MAVIDAIGHALATTAFVEPENEPRPIDRPAVMVRINAQTSPPPHHQSLSPRDELESRQPNQRAIAKDPQVAAKIGRRTQIRGPIRRLHAHLSPSSAARRPKS